MEPFTCIQEMGTKGEIVYLDDLLYYHEEWDRQVVKASRYFDQVQQPSLSIVRPEFIHTFKQVP